MARQPRQPRQPRETKISCRARTAPQRRVWLWSSGFSRSCCPFACLAWFAGNPAPFLGLLPTDHGPHGSEEGPARTGLTNLTVSRVLIRLRVFCVISGPISSSNLVLVIWFPHHRGRRPSSPPQEPIRSHSAFRPRRSTQRASSA
jgi:hypothetical protein